MCIFQIILNVNATCASIANGSLKSATPQSKYRKITKSRLNRQKITNKNSTTLPNDKYFILVNFHTVKFVK